MNANRFFPGIVVGSAAAMSVLLFMSLTNAAALGPLSINATHELKTPGEGSQIILARKMGGGLGGSSTDSELFPSGISGKSGSSNEGDTGGKSMRSFPVGISGKGGSSGGGDTSGMTVPSFPKKTGGGSVGNKPHYDSGAGPGPFVPGKTWKSGDGRNCKTTKSGDGKQWVITCCKPKSNDCIVQTFSTDEGKL